MADIAGPARTREPEDLPWLFLERARAGGCRRTADQPDVVSYGSARARVRVRVIVAPAEAATTASMPAHCAGLIC